MRIITTIWDANLVLVPVSLGFQLRVARLAGLKVKSAHPMSHMQKGLQLDKKQVVCIG